MKGLLLVIALTTIIGGVLVYKSFSTIDRTRDVDEIISEMEINEMN